MALQFASFNLAHMRCVSSLLYLPAKSDRTGGGGGRRGEKTFISFVRLDSGVQVWSLIQLLQQYIFIPFPLILDEKNRIDATRFPRGKNNFLHLAHVFL